MNDDEISIHLCLQVTGRPGPGPSRILGQANMKGLVCSGLPARAQPRTHFLMRTHIAALCPPRARAHLLARDVGITWGKEIGRGKKTEGRVT